MYSTLCCTMCIQMHAIHNIVNAVRFIPDNHCFSHRAVYRKANVYFLDDPLSAVDAAVGQRLFQTCMSGALKNSIVVLVTHHLRYAQLANAMLVLDKVRAAQYS